MMPALGDLVVFTASANRNWNIRRLCWNVLQGNERLMQRLRRLMDSRNSQYSRSMAWLVRFVARTNFDTPHDRTCHRIRADDRLIGRSECEPDSIVNGEGRFTIERHESSALSDVDCHSRVECPVFGMFKPNWDRDHLAMPCSAIPGHGFEFDHSCVRHRVSPLQRFI